MIRLVWLVLIVLTLPRTGYAQSTTTTATSAQPTVATAIFAGGCFWCMESPFEKLPGVHQVLSGYTGGRTKNPTYEQVSSGKTGHTEAVQVTYDPTQVTYEQLLHVFWRNIDPLVKDRQFCDHGNQYRSGIFVQNAMQRQLAEASKKELETSRRFDKPIVTEITDAGPFYPAEEYHQDYYKKNPLRYTYYRNGCGRDKRLQQLWGTESGGQH